MHERSVTPLPPAPATSSPPAGDPRCVGCGHSFCSCSPERTRQSKCACGCVILARPLDDMARIMALHVASLPHQAWRARLGL